MNAREAYLHELDAALRVPRRTRTRILAELGAHYDDVAAEEQGPESLRAKQVRCRLGAPAVVAAACNEEAGRVLAGEAAVVAWLRALARVLAARSSCGLAPADRVLVRCCDAIALAGCGVAAIGWSCALLVSVWARGSALGVGGIFACALSAFAVVLGWSGWAVLRFNADGRTAVPATSEWARPVPHASRVAHSVSWLERAVLDQLDRRPVAVRALVAGATGAWVLLHAETATVAGAWPWALAQAVGVVVGFVVLGPRLGLPRGALDR